MTKLYLDDLRSTPFGWDRVKSYAQFVMYIEQFGVPDVISFDHDLGFEHYPLSEDKPGMTIPYETYKEKTGYDCAKYIVENELELKQWAVHSFNPVGADNIRKLLRAYEERRAARTNTDVRSGELR
jgi:hypothetical protein